MRFDKQAAMKAVAEAKLAPANSAVADHWFSLWNGDALPSRGQLKPADLKALLPDLLLFDVVPEKSVTVRLAGTNISKALGFELTGRDWLATAAPEHRDARLALFTAVARGAIGYGYRRVTMNYGGDTCSEELLLPFAADPGSEIYELFAHIHWAKAFQFANPVAPDKLIDRAPGFAIIPLQRV
jgi:hypothetical protein